MEDDSADVRRQLYLQGSITYLQHFQNHRKLFFPDVHASYRFVIIVYSPSSKYDHSFSTVARLPEETAQAHWIFVPRDKLHDELGVDLSTSILNSKQYYDCHRSIIEYLQNLPQMNYSVVAEFHATSDKSLTVSFMKDNTEWRLLKNDSIHQFNHQFSDVDKYIPLDVVRAKCVQKGINPEVRLRSNRLVFRDIARNDDSRTLISCLAPPGYVSSYDTPMVVPVGASPEDLQVTLQYLCGFFNSFTFDFLIRPYVDKHIKGYVLQRLPIPAFDPTNKHMQKIAILVSELSQILPEQLSQASEQQDVLYKKATLEALVAQIAGLSGSDLSFVLETFPIVREADIRQYGEYRTRRLVLEAWDREHQQ